MGVFLFFCSKYVPVCFFGVSVLSWKVCKKAEKVLKLNSCGIFKAAELFGGKGEVLRIFYFFLKVCIILKWMEKSDRFGRF